MAPNTLQFSSRSCISVVLSLAALNVGAGCPQVWGQVTFGKPAGNSFVFLSPDVVWVQVLSLWVGEMEYAPTGSYFLSLIAASKAMILLVHFWKLIAWL